MSVEPWINWQFHKTPRWLDPRVAFSRASVGRTDSRIGLVSAVPANVGRWRFNPTTRLCEGLLCEPQRTNLILWSEDFTNAAWTASSLTPTANTIAAPDGTTTADTLAVTGAGGKISQAIAITAGRGIAYGPYLKANATSWAIVSLSDGTNSVDCWFNLASGPVGTRTNGGTGSGTSVLYSNAWVELAANGFWRCAVEVTTSVATAVVLSIAPTSADNTPSATGNSCYAWGAQGEADATLTNLTSYIPTTSAAVTRSADNLSLAISQSQFPGDRGTMVFEWTQRTIPVVTGGPAIVLGGLGNASGFTDFIYVSRTAATALGLNYSVGGVGTPLLQKTCAFTPGTIYRLAITWQTGRLAWSLDGGAVTATTSNVNAHTNLARLAIGYSPWGASSTTISSNVVHRAFLYAPHTVTDALLQQLTAP